MFGIGLPELVIIAIVALVFIGPKNLPGVLRSLGRGLVEIKRATNDVRSTVQEEMNRIEQELDLKDVKEATSDLQKEFEGVSSKMNQLSLNRMSTGEQLETIAEVLDKNKEDAEKGSSTSKHSSANDTPVETQVAAPVFTSSADKAVETVGEEKDAETTHSGDQTAPVQGNV